MKLGHVVDKVEFILMGGTFMSLPPDYRDYFIRNLHDALSGGCVLVCAVCVVCKCQCLFRGYLVTTPSMLSLSL